MPIRVADDHAAVRSGLHRLLDAGAGIDVIGEAVNGRQAVESDSLEPTPQQPAGR